MREITVYEGPDVFLRNAVRLRIPHGIATIEELLSMVGEAVAMSPRGPSAARRYRFAYSLDGSPLVSVEECLDAGTLVVSCTPGFTERRGSERSPDRPALSPFDERGSDTCGVTESRRLSSVTVSHGNFERLSSKPRSISLASRGYFSCENIPGRISTISSIRGSTAELGGMVCSIGNKRIVLPPTPSFDTFSHVEDLEMSHIERVAAVKTLITLKLCGCSLLEDDLLFEKELARSFLPIIAEQAKCRLWGEYSLDCSPPHVVVDGPPKSGVSSSLAYYSSSLVSSVESRFTSFLILPLNFELLFDGLLTVSARDSRNGFSGSRSATYNDMRTQSFLLDVPFFFMTIVRTLVDCVVAQKPCVRDSSTALVGVWEQLIKTATQGEIYLNTRGVAHAVGHDALHKWEIFATPAAEILRAAKLNPRDIELRDVMLELVLVELVAQVSSALHFRGVVYVIDGLRPLCRSLSDRLRRPGGDAAVFLDRVTRRSWAHVAVGVDSLSTQTLDWAIPTRVRRVKLLHLLSVENLTKHYGFPTAIHCGRRKYPLEMFLGAPGYLRMVHDLLRSCDGRRIERGSNDEYAIRVEGSEVSNALEEFAAVQKLREDTVN